MGTKVQCKSYSPVCYSLRDLNKNALSGSWPKCNDDRSLTSGLYYDRFLQRQATDGSSENDMEKLKQAMLKHEIIFRDQVHELHRLYGIQRDFMDKLKKKELNQGPQSSPFSQIPSKDVPKVWRIPQNPFASSAFSIPSTTYSNNIQSPMNFHKESYTQISPDPTLSKSSLLDRELLESTSKQFQLEKLDLQLPVDEYLANEEARQIGQDEITRVNLEEKYPLKRISRTASENDTSNGGPGSQGDASNFEIDAKRKHVLADLNQPVQVEAATGASPNNFLDPASCYRKNQEKSFCSQANSVFIGLSLEYLNTERGRDNRMYVNIQHLEIKGNRQELEMQSDSFPGSSSVSSWIKTKRIPCVEPSASLSNKSMLPVLNLGSEEMSHPKGTIHELHSESNSSLNHFRSVGLDYSGSENMVASGDTVMHLKGSNCTNVEFEKDMDLNVGLADGLRVGMSPKQDFVVGNEGKNDELPRASCMLRMNSICNDGSSNGRGASKQPGLDFLQGFSQHSSCNGVGKVSTASSIQNSTSASCASNFDFQMLAVGECPSTERIFGFPIVNKLHFSKDQSSLSNSLQYQSQAVEAWNTAKVENLSTGISCDTATFHLGEQSLSNNLIVDKGTNKDFPHCGNQNSSNSCTTEELILPKITKKIPVIDLEATVDADIFESVSTQEDSLMSIQSSQNEKDGLQELVKIAAEEVVIGSTSGNQDSLKDATSSSLETTTRDPLQWFAEVITSTTGDAESEVSLDDEKSSRGMDYFESMTLQLTETKEDEYCNKHMMPEYAVEVTNSSSQMSQRCRGKGRRGGQQRNFQRDVLPGFVSLAKHEISEDLEMLEGLMRSMGHSWQIGLARRTAARNGRVRGKGQSRGSSLIWERPLTTV